MMELDTSRIDDISQCKAGKTQQMTPPKAFCSGLHLQGRQLLHVVPCSALGSKAGSLSACLLQQLEPAGQAPPPRV